MGKRQLWIFLREKMDIESKIHLKTSRDKLSKALKLHALYDT